MVVGNTLGAAELLRKYLQSDAGSDLLNEMVKMAAELLMDAEVEKHESRQPGGLHPGRSRPCQPSIIATGSERESRS